jgi:hypothetical protein
MLLMSLPLVLAARARGDAVGEVLVLAFLFGVGYVVLSFFFRRIGGKDGGSEKASVGAWVLLAAIVVGVLVANRGH